MTMKYRSHEFAMLLPTTSDDDYAAIKADIESNGQKVPIVLYDGKILDGRTRAKACEELGIELWTERFRGNVTDALRKSCRR